MKQAYALYLHEKGIDWSSGYGTEYLQGVALTEEVAKRWVVGFKESGFARRIYKPIDLVE